MNPLVSVIVPAYNAARWIGDALSSAIGQTWKNLEVVVIDDGSDDGTAEAVTAFAGSGVRLLTQRHRGASAARNLGLRETRGALVQFLDADDVLSLDKIERQVNVLGNEPPGTIASCAWARFTNTPTDSLVRPEPVWTVGEPLEWIVSSLAGGGMMQPCAWLTPRSLIDAAGPWDESLSLHDDGEFFTRVLLAAKRNMFVHGVTAFYRDTDGSLSRRRSRAAVESALTVCRLREKHLLDVRDDIASRRALATQYAQFAYEFSSAAPDLTAEAMRSIRRLGVRPAVGVGGRLFRLTAATLGLEVALRLRSSRTVT